MEDKPTPKMEASLGLCQPQRNNYDMEIKSEFSKGREVSKEGQRETMTSPTIQVVSLDAGREKFKFLKDFSFSSQSLAPVVLFLLYHCCAIR